MSFLVAHSPCRFASAATCPFKCPRRDVCTSVPVGTVFPPACSVPRALHLVPLSVCEQLGVRFCSGYLLGPFLQVSVIAARSRFYGAYSWCILRRPNADIYTTSLAKTSVQVSLVIRDLSRCLRSYALLDMEDAFRCENGYSLSGILFRSIHLSASIL